MDNYKTFLESKKDIPQNLPDEVIKSSLTISRSMYDKVKKYSFFIEDDDFFIRFEVTPSDFKYVDSSDVFTLELSTNINKKHKYYVELVYDDQIPSTLEVIYKILFEKISNKID